MSTFAPFPAGFTRPERDPACRQASVPAGEETLVYKPIAPADGSAPVEAVVYAIAGDDPAGHAGKRVVYKGPIGQAWETWLQLGGIPQ